MGQTVVSEATHDVAPSRGFGKPWLFPNTQGEWRYVSYTMSPLEHLGDIVFFNVKGSPGTVVDLDQILRKPDKQPLVFSFGRRAFAPRGLSRRSDPTGFFRREPRRRDGHHIQESRQTAGGCSGPENRRFFMGSHKDRGLRVCRRGHGWSRRRAEKSVDLDWPGTAREPSRKSRPGTIRRRSMSRPRWSVGAMRASANGDFEIRLRRGILCDINPARGGDRRLETADALAVVARR